MISEFIYRIETYKTSSGWEYQIQVRNQLKQSRDVGICMGIHDSKGGKPRGYETEKEALLLAKPRLKKMTDSIIKDLINKNPLIKQL